MDSERSSTHFMRLFALCLLLASHTSLASPLDEGVAAFNAGNYQQAFELWKPLAEAGNANAQYNIGLLFLNGLGLERNAVYARELFLAAAHQGLADAQYNLGLIFFEGISVFRSPREARQWWTLAAEQGHAAAQFNLGYQYLFGMGAPRNIKLGFQLWEASAAQGYPQAIETLARVYESGEIDDHRDPQRAKYWRERAAP